MNDFFPPQRWNETQFDAILVERKFETNNLYLKIKISYTASVIRLHVIDKPIYCNLKGKNIIP